MRSINVNAEIRRTGWLIAGSLLLALSLASCGGNTDGGSAADENFQGTSYTGFSGSIALNVLEDELQVSQVSGFAVTVRDATGSPVREIKVYCDTEKGLELIEPTTGHELTDVNGTISGKVGCAVPGSLQIGCRLPIGANKRQFHTIRCAGPIPSGFSGFGSTAGGGLGGGVATDENGGIGGSDSENGARITNVEFIDNGSTASTAIDVVQGYCGTGTCPGTGCTLEPFFDTHVDVTVLNNTNQSIRFTSMRYRVPNATGVPSGTFTSDSIAIGDGIVSAAGGEKTMRLLFADISSVGKIFAGSSTAIPDDFGFRNITFLLSGENDLGEAVEVSASASVSFDNYCSCSGSACAS